MAGGARHASPLQLLVKTYHTTHNKGEPRVRPYSVFKANAYYARSASGRTGRTAKPRCDANKIPPDDHEPTLDPSHGSAMARESLRRRLGRGSPRIHSLGHSPVWCHTPHRKRSQRRRGRSQDPPLREGTERARINAWDARRSQRAEPASPTCRGLLSMN